ncbi:MAG: ribonuclease H-like domain-containing protein [Chitinophagales bacterium]
MLSLKERLAALKESRALGSDLPAAEPAAGGSPPRPVVQSRGEPAAAASSPVAGPRFDLADLVPGEEVETPFGRCFHRVIRFPVEHCQGCHALADALSVPPEVGGRLARPRLPGLDFRRAIFLDTETTGLSGGTGTYVFLVGFGHFSGEEFLLHQYFLRHHGEETALLWAVGEALRPFPYLVTFNGRRFDWPLLETRFTCARLRSHLPAVAHVDLLYPSWNLWRQRLGSCRLGNLEGAILAAPRHDDVPGELIPGLYFNYLRTGDARPLVPVLEHNLLDLLSLVSLTAAVGHRLAYPGSRAAPEDLLAVGRFYEREGEEAVAACCYREAAAGGAGCREALYRLAAIAKRQGDYRAAEESLLRLADEYESLEALVELAKLYEHRFASLDRARECTERALALVRRRAQLYGRQASAALAELRHRHERLLRKLAKGSSPAPGSVQIQ